MPWFLWIIQQLALGWSYQIVNIRQIIEKARKFQKIIYFCFIDYAKAFDCVDHNKLHKTLKEMGIPDHLPASWEICMQVKNQQLELGMEQHTGSILGMQYVKAVFCHSAYLTYMQSTSGKMLGWMKHKLESRLLGEISITSDMQMSPPIWQKVKNKRAFFFKNFILFLNFTILYKFCQTSKWIHSECWALSQLFHCPLSLSSRGSLVLHFLP